MQLTAYQENEVCFMLSHIYLYIYNQPLDRVANFSIAIVIGWAVLMHFVRENSRLLRCINKFFTASAFIIILYATMLDRNVGSCSHVFLQPFSSLSQDRFSAELLRQCIMNMFLFVPLGIFMPYAMPKNDKNKIKTTIIFGLCVSICVELLQGLFKMGWCETDDIINNTIGIALGTRSYMIFEKIPQLMVYINDIKKRIFSYYRENTADKTPGRL